MISNERLWQETFSELEAMHITETLVGHEYLTNFIMLYAKEPVWMKENVGYVIRYFSGCEDMKDEELERSVLSSCAQAIRRSRKVLGDSQWLSLFPDGKATPKIFSIRMAQFVSARVKE